MPTFSKQMFLNRIQKLDAFGQPVQLRVNGKRHYQTTCGAFFTCFVFVFTLWFSLHLILLFVQRSDQLRMHHKTLQPGDDGLYDPQMKFQAGETVQERLVHSGWGSPDPETVLDKIKESHKFNVAFGLSDLPDSPLNVEDENYGNLEAIQTHRLSDGTFQYLPIGTEPCSKAYLDEKFYDARKHVQDQISFNSDKLLCLAPNAENLDVMGEFNEPESKTFSIFFTSCDTLWNADCRSIEEVTEWLSHKYIFIAYTERRFSHQSGKAIEETKMVRLPINKLTNTHFRLQIEVTHLVDLDNLSNTVWPSGERSFEDFYQVNQLPDQPLVERLPPNDNTYYFPNRFQVSFEISDEQMEVHVLPTFTTIEIISSIGGLLFVASIIGGAIFSLYAKFHLENYLMSKLYKNIALPSDNDEQDKPKKAPWGQIKQSAKVQVADFEDHSQIDNELALSDRVLEPRLKTDGSDKQQFEGGEQIKLMRERESIRLDKAYYLSGIAPFNQCTRYGKAARVGKQKLKKHLELSRILKRMNNTKAAIELMIMPDQRGLAKVNKKLFPVCSSMQEFSDSTSEEEKMLATALENIKSRGHGGASLVALDGLGESGNLFKRQEELKSANLDNTNRGLLDSIRSNVTGEAFYDSQRNIMSQVTDSHASIALSSERTPKYSARTGSKGSKGRQKSKRSFASVVMEEPSKEDKGFAFNSRYSMMSSNSYKSSVNIQIKKSSKKILQSPFVNEKSPSSRHQSPMSLKSKSPRKSLGSVQKKSKSPRKYSPTKSSPRAHHSTIQVMSPRFVQINPSPVRSPTSKVLTKPRLPFSFRSPKSRPYRYVNEAAENVRRQIEEQQLEIKEPVTSSLQQKMMMRLNKKSGMGIQTRSPRNSSSGSKPKVSAQKPKYHNGNFQVIEPINPNRQRITVETVDQSSERNNSLGQVKRGLSPNQRQSSVDSDPYPNIIIYGNAEKLYGEHPSDHMLSNTTNIETLPLRNLGDSKEFKTRDSNCMTVRQKADQIVFANQSLSNATSMTGQRQTQLRESAYNVDYKPPPSAPAGQNPRSRVKMFTTMQPRPYKLVGDPSILPESQHAPEQSMSPKLLNKAYKEKVIQRSGQTQVHEERRNPSAHVHRSIVHVPDQKLGPARTRILMSQDDLQLIGPPGQVKSGNYVKEDQQVCLTVESDGVNLERDSIIENNYGGDAIGDAPFEQSKATSSHDQ